MEPWLNDDDRRNSCTWSKTCPTATSPTKNSTWSGLGSNVGVRSDRSVTNHLSHSYTACRSVLLPLCFQNSWCKYMCNVMVSNPLNSTSSHWMNGVLLGHSSLNTSNLMFPLQFQALGEFSIDWLTMHVTYNALHKQCLRQFYSFPTIFFFFPRKLNITRYVQCFLYACNTSYKPFCIHLWNLASNTAYHSTTSPFTIHTSKYREPQGCLAY